MSNLIKYLYDTIYFTGPILLCTLGGLFAYKANMVNIGLEGMMLFGGFISALVIFYTHSFWLGIVSVIIFEILIGLLFSYFAVTRKANFIITGFAINLLATAVGYYTIALMKSTDINIIMVEGINKLKVNLWLIKDIPGLGDVLSGHPPFTYLSFILIFVVYYLIYKTKFGTYVRVVGENEEAARSVGIKDNYIRYLAIIIGAVFCGFAGYNVAVEKLASYTPAITAGTGFIAIAAIYCGNGDPKKSSIYALLFGLTKALAVNLSLHIGSIAGLFEIIPYLTIIIALSFVAVLRKRKTHVRGFINE